MEGYHYNYGLGLVLPSARSTICHAESFLYGRFVFLMFLQGHATGLDVVPSNDCEPFI
jgi:hypothetical protein